MLKAAHIQHDGKRWKHYYAEAEIDAKRSTITFEELTNFRWAFCFKMNPFFAVDNSEYRVHDYPRFNPDFTFTSSMFRHVMRWRFPFSERNRVQVEEYPYLEASRTPDWGWKLTNPFVVFTSMDVDPDEFTILEQHLRAAMESRLVRLRGGIVEDEEEDDDDDWNEIRDDEDDPDENMIRDMRDVD